LSTTIDVSRGLQSRKISREGGKIGAADGEESHQLGGRVKGLMGGVSSGGKRKTENELSIRWKTVKFHRGERVLANREKSWKGGKLTHRTSANSEKGTRS